jgi:hypothetical protein
MPSTLGIVASAHARPWTPIEVQAELWLDANDADTITQSSGFVSLWEDKSGNGRNAQQATGDNQPAIGVTTLNGRNVISFNGTGSFFKVADFYAPLTNVYSVVQTGSTTGAQHIVRKGYTTTSNSFEYLLRMNNQDYQVVLTQEVGVTATLTVATQVTTSPKILGYDWNGGSVFLYRNGTSLGGIAASLNQFDATQELRIGASHTSTSDDSAPTGVLNGYIAELVLVSGSLNTADRQKLEGYLAHKWGLTSVLPSGHPYTEVAPTIN